jgi:hypothetical protein
MKYIVTTLILLANIVFAQRATLVHGLNNDASIFYGTKIQQVVNDEFGYPSPLIPSLGGNLAANTQSTNLDNTLVSNNVREGLSVSYSMGGVVTRNYMKSKYPSNNNLLDGHISIATPHLGAKIVNNAELAARLILDQAEAIIFPGWIDGTTLHVPFDAAGLLAVLALNSYVNDMVSQIGSNAAAQDLRTNSQVITDINSSSAYEQEVFKAGIYCRELEPVLYNMLVGDISISENGISWLVDLIYATKLSFIIYHLYAYNSAADAGNAYWMSYHSAMFWAHIDAYVFFSNFNYYWKEYVLESSYSDGVVGETSQQYPNANQLYLAQNTSHLEARNHNEVESQLRRATLAYKDNILNSPPTSPINVSIAWYNDHPRITWETNPEYDVQSYKIRKEVAGSSMIAATITHNKYSTTHSWIDYDVDKPGKFDPQVLCKYKIKAVDIATNESNYSEEVSITGNTGLWKGNENGTENDEQDIIEYNLASNYPNPFNPTTSITYKIPTDGFVNLTVYNSIGEVVDVLVNEFQAKSSYSIEFNASKLPSGIYLYKLQSNEFSEVKKMILAK